MLWQFPPNKEIPYLLSLIIGYFPGVVVKNLNSKLGTWVHISAFFLIRCCYMNNYSMYHIFLNVWRPRHLAHFLTSINLSIWRQAVPGSLYILPERSYAASNLVKGSDILVSWLVLLSPGSAMLSGQHSRNDDIYDSSSENLQICGHFPLSNNI